MTAPVVRGPRPTRAWLQAPEARTENRRGPALLCRAARAGDRRDPRHPVGNSQVPAPLRDGGPPSCSRGRREGRHRDERTTSMKPDRSVDERISAWLIDAAPDQLPDRVLDAAFARTHVTGQRRRPWLQRETRMPRTPLLVAAGAAAIVVAVVGALVLFPRPAPSVGTVPTST